MADTIDSVRTTLLSQIAESDSPRDILRAPELKSIAAIIPTLPPEERSGFGKQLNELRQELAGVIEQRELALENANQPAPIDVTAPWDVNAGPVSLLPTESGSVHPLMREIRKLSGIFERMGFVIEDSREIDDTYHMFDALNFPKGHPARDDYDTFQTVETDQSGEPLVAPAHTSTMQNRVLKKYKENLMNGEPIAVVVPDRVFRNEDLDARHEHTFYQVEGVYVSKGVTIGNLIATLQTFLEEYYGKALDIRTNPFYFPFTEPSFEFALSCPFCEKAGCKVCSFEGWIELIGCGMIHPNVLKAAGIDPTEYTGFAWGLGIDRLVMMKNGIEDVRHFESAKLDFLRQF
ncbi:MAG TPA: phenylalanine--tRNA ligase subunit alpha [Candidatus Saccharibacteria bacterium]|nr:phenylalanine--tRNA ligase subunit alpha [Candidatus Saccharibacteria bacterium]